MGRDYKIPITFQSSHRPPEDVQLGISSSRIVDDQGENRSWKAIGYCGPDPDFKAQIQRNKPPKGIVSVHPRPDCSRKEEHNVGDEEELFGPLYKGIVDLNNPRHIVVEALQRSGFGVSTPHQKVTTPNSSLNPSLIIKCDAVVVGSGSGGGVIAGVLANAGPSPDTWPAPEKKSYEGAIMTAMSTIGNYDKSDYGGVIQTPPLHPGMFSVLTPWVSGIDIKMRMSKFSRTAHVYILTRDKGSGEVASASSICYRMDKIDEENLQRGLEKLLRILAAAGAEKIGTQHRDGKVLDVKRASSMEFERFVKEESSRGLREFLMPICSSHQMGTCRMGVEQKGSAVAPTGETWEVEGLYVADSSVFPTALGVNPMVTIQAIAYCTAQSVLEVLKRKTSK
ncbi:long-chain-alcohol oxidase [Sarracenia purpurea var. burkii]